LLSTATAVIILDQWSKTWVRANLALGESRPEAGILRLTHVGNTGSAFGFFADQTSFLVLVTVAVLALIPFLLRYLSYHYPTLLRVRYPLCLGLVLGGAVGNLVDRLRFGFVTDFIDVRLWGDFHWPAFNVADASIVVGILGILFLLAKAGLLSNKPPK
jgi:signal peptidase II